MFSIIIPLYNKAPYVEKTLKSVLNQTYQEFEVIVVDDGSTDKSLEIVEHFNKSVSQRLNIISQKNQGVSTARNNGVKLAKNPYICFLDADDWWEPTFLEEMKALIEEYPEAGIYGAGFYSVKKGVKRSVNLGVDREFDKGYVNYSLLLLQEGCRPVCTGSSVISKVVFQQINGFRKEIKLGEDFDLYYRCFLKKGLVLLNKPLFNYNQDVDPKFRAISKLLYDKEESVFWNLDYPEQKTNSEVKILIDVLKLRSYYPYFLAGKYRDDVIKEIGNIDLSLYDKKHFFRYKIIPIWIQKKRLQIKSKVYVLKLKMKK